MSNFKYIETVKEYLTCNNCQNIPINPFLCHHQDKITTLCEMCIKKCNQCVTDSNPKINDFVKQILDDLMVECTNTGCDYKATRLHFTLHHKCDFRLYVCPYGCGLTGLLHNQAYKHIMECNNITKNQDYYHDTLITCLKTQQNEINQLNDKINEITIENNNLNIMIKDLVNKLDESMKTQDNLLNACQNGNITMVTTFLCSPNLSVHEKNEALQIAVINGHLDIVKLLCENGANIHAREDRALRMSVLYSHNDIFNYLLSLGADIGVRKYDILIKASEVGNLELVKQIYDLMDQRCHTHRHSKCKWILPRAMNTAYLNGFNNIVRFYAGKKITCDAFVSAYTRGDITMIMDLIDHGIGINDGYFTSALISLCQSQNISAVKTIVPHIKQGVIGGCILEIDNFELVEYLLNFCDIYGYVHMVHSRLWEKNSSIIKLILKKIGHELLNRYIGRYDHEHDPSGKRAKAISNDPTIIDILLEKNFDCKKLFIIPISPRTINESDYLVIIKYLINKGQRIYEDHSFIYSLIDRDSGATIVDYFVSTYLNHYDNNFFIGLVGKCKQRGNQYLVNKYNTANYLNNSQIKYI